MGTVIVLMIVDFAAKTVDLILIVVVVVVVVGDLTEMMIVERMIADFSVVMIVVECLIIVMIVTAAITDGEGMIPGVLGDEMSEEEMIVPVALMMMGLRWSQNPKIALEEDDSLYKIKNIPVMKI